MKTPRPQPKRRVRNPAKKKKKINKVLTVACIPLFNAEGRILYIPAKWTFTDIVKNGIRITLKANNP